MLVRLSGVAFLAGALTLSAGARQDPRRPAGTDFPVVGGNFGNQRFSTLSRIDRSNVSKLGGAWLVHLEDGAVGGNMQGTPVVVGGVLYIGSTTGSVFAINAADGTRTWKYTSTFGSQINRGVAVGAGKVFTGQGGTRLVALDAKTGTLAWEIKLADRGGTPGTPMYYDGLVYAGISGGEAGVRGQVGAYDAATGKEVWKFYTIPGPGEFGHDSWEGDSWMRGGGPLWTQGAIDPDLALLYVPVGNPYPTV